MVRLRHWCSSVSAHFYCPLNLVTRSFSDLAAHFTGAASNFDFSVFRAHDTIRQAIAKTVPGMEQLADIGVAKKEFHVRRRLLHRPDFKTDSGRAAFVAHGAADRRNVESAYPFLLMSVRSEGQFNSIIYEENDSYRGAEHRRVVFMALGDMLSLGIGPGRRVTLRSEQGELCGLEVREFDLPPGNLMDYYPEANVLTGRRTDPRSQTPAFKSTPVAVELA